MTRNAPRNNKRLFPGAFLRPRKPIQAFYQCSELAVRACKEFSPNYIRIVQGMLSIAFDRAIVLGIAKKNPSRMVGNIKSKKTKVDFWTLEEFQKVISLLYKGDYYEHYLFISFWLLFMTGMRIGEAAALQWSDIDFETGLSNINKTLYYKSMDEYKFVDPKTQASVRTIYIDADTIRELKAWRAVQQKVLKGCGFILSYSGIPTSKHTLPRALEKLAGLAGVHRIKIHSLRHPYVKHTTKKYNSEKQKTQATKMDLIAWVFRFCIFNYSKRSWIL